MVPSEKVVHTSLFGIYMGIVVLCIISVQTLNNVNHPEIRFICSARSRFYTHWGFVSQLIYIVSVVLSHFLSQKPKTCKERNIVRKFADLIFTTIALPNALGITINFWTVYFIDRELFYPTVLDEYIPWWINHSLHTLNSVLIVVDILLTKHKFPSWSVFTKCFVSFAVCYNVVMVDSKIRYGRHLYRMFEVLTPLQIVFATILNLVASYIYYGAAKSFSNWRWGGVVTEITQTKECAKVQ